MQANTQNVGIAKSWTLVEFYAGKRLKIAPFVNPNTGEEFKSLAFIDKEDKVTLVGFSSNLGELTAQQLKEQKHDLQVVQLTSGNYKLCKRGEDSWESVEL